MAKKKKKIRSAYKSVKVVISLLLIIASIIGGWLIYDNGGIGGGGSSSGGSSSGGSGSKKEEAKEDLDLNGIEAEGDPIKVYFLDVGQADCTVIMSNQGNMIIDAGSNSSQKSMKAYIDKLGISEFEYAIFTHPHEDHIGGSEVILDNYKVENVIIPDYEATTKTYLTMLESIENCGANLEIIEEGENFEFSIGELKAQILAPIKFDKNTNNASIVTRLDYGETSIMLTGDAEGEKADDPENLILEKYKDNLQILDCDIHKLGHHGSSTSTNQKFLDAVSPQIAIISCGVDNDYGHPHQEIIERLEKGNITYYRTDELGTILLVIYKNGYKISDTTK